MNVDITKRFWTGESELDYHGPWAGLVIAFGGPERETR
jgi:hypothetical protein